MKEHEINRTRLVNLLGKNGSGKGKTTSLYIEQEARKGMTVRHVSTGEILRVAHSGDTSHQLAEKYADLMHILSKRNENEDRMTQGLLLNGEKLKALLEFPKFAVIEATLLPIDVVIFDGTTRTRAQWDGMRKFIKKYKEDVGAPIKLTHVYLDVEDEVVIERSKKRVEEYKREGKTPRKDDEPEKVLRRLEVFTRETVPLLKFLQKKGKLNVIDGSQPPETVVEVFTSVVEMGAVSDKMEFSPYFNGKKGKSKNPKHF